MHQPGRPSSSTAQHVINMAGMDPGLGLMGSIGGGSSSGSNNSHHAIPSVGTGAIAANAAMMAAAPPGAYRNTPSRQYDQSALSPANISPQRVGSSNSGGGGGPGAYASPSSRSHMSTALSPSLSSGPGGSPNSSGHLGRSQSLGHAAYHQYQQHQQQQQRQQQQQQQQQRTSFVGQPPLSPSAADMYAMANQQRRDRSQQYSDGSMSNGISNPSNLLPVINTHIPSGSLNTTSPYGSPSVNRQSVPPLSPNMTSPYNSPYAPTVPISSGNRPVSMIDGANHLASSSSYAGAQTISPVAGTSKRASIPHAQGLDPNAAAGSSLLPMHHSPQLKYGDSLPLYTTGAGNRPPSSPYMPVSPNMASAKVGAPPRTSIGNSYSPSTSASYDHRMSMEAKGMPTMDPNATLKKERRGTMTGQDSALSRAHLGEFDVWDRQQRAQRKRLEGFRRVRDLSDLKVNLEPAQQGKGRRADPMGGYVSPLKAMTAYLHHTYHLVNPAFIYELSFNPRRVLTKPSRPMYNDGHDNEDSDYILYVNDWLGSEESNRYLILDILGQGTFGQVVKCQNMRTREIVAVKVIKNKPAYFDQSMMEVTILEMLNGNWDPNDEHHILRLRDTFIHAKHLCLVFELLSSNLYELIKQNSFRGLSTSLVRVFTTQLLDALTVLHEARLIHCDLKPENILLKTLQTPTIKLVDFGSACHERQTVYTYIQSRFYRSPEVLLGLPYNAAIDMWSLGCIAIELFLGLPLFPGTSEYNQICRIVEMLGLPPRWMLEQGKQTGEFFNIWTDEYGRRQYKVKGLDQYSKEHNVQEQPSKRYFQAKTLPDIVKTYPMSRKSGKPADVQKEMANRTSFIDFVSGLLNMDPNLRWTPEQAKLHPFITGEKFVQPFQPPLSPATSIQRGSARRASGSSGSIGGGATDKHPFGGLVSEGTNRSSGRTYQDAAAYNQHLAQQQAYNQAHQARQNQSHNPYAREDDVDKMASSNSQAKAAAAAAAVAATQAQLAHAQAHAHAQAQAAQLHAAAMSPPYASADLAAQKASGVSYGANRSRSNTLTRMDVIPPQLAKMGLEQQPAHSMTPVLNREESLREWERQQQMGGAGLKTADQQQRSSGRSGGGGSKSRNGKDYHNLDLLQQQAEQAHHQNAQWQQAQAAQSQYNTSTMTPSQVAAHKGGNSFSVMIDPQQQQQSGDVAKESGSSGQIVAPPPVVYASGNNGGNSSSAARFASNGAAGLSFDPYKSDIAQLMPALQPTQYHTIGHSAIQSPLEGSAGQGRLGGAGTGANVALNRHSIAVPHMASPHQYNAASGSIANLQGLYASPSSSDAGLHSTGSAPFQLSSPQTAPGPPVNGAVRSDGFGGLSDLMFSNGAPAGIAAPPLAGQLYPTLNGPPASLSAEGPATPSRSPIDPAHLAGYSSSMAAGRRY